MPRFRRIFPPLFWLLLWLPPVTVPAGAGEPPGAPGIPHSWAPALKQAIGTAYEKESAHSPVWFTVAEGILTEVFYPTVDQAQVGDLQFLVTDGRAFFSEQRRDTAPEVNYLDEGMTVRVSGKDRSGRYSYEQLIVTDPAAPVVRMRTTFHWGEPGLRLFVLFKPAIGNAGVQNLGLASHLEGLFATRFGTPSPDFRGRIESPVHAAVLISAPWRQTSAGFVGFSDGWQDLSRNFELANRFDEAGPGNIALTGEVQTNPGAEFTLDLALGFGVTRSEAQNFAKTSLSVPFERVRREYESGWTGYLDELVSAPRLGSRRFLAESPFARRSTQIIKMHEDKRNRGAIIASMSKPGVPDGERARDGTGGYHLIWPRDLYHAAMGLLAAGDTQTPVDVLKYLARTQSPNGDWSQNFWVSGKPYWTGLQLDEVSFPVLLAAQLKRRIGYDFTRTELEMIRRAVDFIIQNASQNGPLTQQDRWEEIGGFVPSTIAAQIAALRAGAELLGDPQALAIASRWNAMIESWTLVGDGPHGRNYYLRASPGGSPNSPEPIQIANGGGPAYAWEILDGGFLELVRLGVREWRDPRVLNTLRIYEDPALGISAGPAGAKTYRRYNRDAYGEQRVGGFWPLLAGERGHYAVAAGDLSRAQAQLFVVEKSALGSGLLPEQTIRSPLPSGAGLDAGLGVACPLVWAHAEDILLHRSIEEGKIFDAPQDLP